ncbi:LPS O-antigen chain length determinant protein WzzB [Neptuniibacter caesariensis]|uniref:O-antigen chain length regulator n=1 Tax=Neptuniibacter caesariensis TaxID=207954 RepID=A0A7U8GRR0_NEPCE|nr:Wzz/FepE/Etk N-terminal domain-containing protein [Neptuniibacter caesariensis]EAR60508.1 O-antigen chain length regulator [Oceanospirillum sp. MED92] [Neptuniibacter caesariensis]
MEQKHSPEHPLNDHIDLFFLFLQLWRSKLLILGITALITLCGAAYSFLSTPIYQSSAVLASPSESDLIEIRKIHTLLQQIIYSETASEEASTTDIFGQFISALNSNRYKNSFLSKPELLDHFRNDNTTQLQARKEFNRALKVTLPDTEEINHITISLRTKSPELSSSWLNEYISFAHQQFSKELTNNLQARIHAAQNNLLLTIQSKKANYHSNLIEEIKSIEEALIIANEIGLVNPLKTETNFGKQHIIDQMRGIYRLGSKSLNAELNALKAREKNLDNIPGLSDEKLKLELLANIDLDSKLISAMILDLAAEPAPKPIEPRKTIIILLSIVAGLLIGIMTVLAGNLVRHRRT